jgi:hypothetical protein
MRGISILSLVVMVGVGAVGGRGQEAPAKPPAAARSKDGKKLFGAGRSYREQLAGGPGQRKLDRRVDWALSSR